MKRLLQLACLAGWMLSSPAMAENSAFPLERMRNTLDGDGVLGTESGRVGPAGTWSASAQLNLAHAPLVLRSSSGERLAALVSNRVGFSVSGSFAVLDWAAIGFEMPFVVMQTRGEGYERAIADAPVTLMPGLGDLRFGLKLALFDRPGGFDVAALLAATVPTGGGISFRGDAGMTLQPEIALSRRWSRFRFALNLGATLRNKTKLGTQVIGSEGATRVGLGWWLLPDARFPTELMAAFDGATALGSPFGLSNVTPAEARVGANVTVRPQWTASAGVGLGLVAGWGTPDWRLFAGIRYEPAPPPPDRDQDGLPDADDKCPREPETFNGFEDTDGCPDKEPDTDGDGLPDARDRCPNEAETKNGFQDDDGCPDVDPNVADDDQDGIRNLDDQCPLEPETKNGLRDGDGCPESDRAVAMESALGAAREAFAKPPVDTDGDGLADDVDRCTKEAENVNGIEDTDGCPDPDADGDEIPDAQDKCPFEAENVNGWEDTDGCPDEVPRALKDVAGAIKGIEFDTAKATLKPVSEKVLLKALDVLQSKDALRFNVVIEGHTDDRGKHDENVKLSEARAATVREWLVSHGVAATRLRSEGFGPDKPVDTNTTDVGRARNRRVAFRLEDPSAKQERR